MKQGHRAPTPAEVKDLIGNTVQEIVTIINAQKAESFGGLSHNIEQYVQKKVIEVVSLVASVVDSVHEKGITFAVWAGPPGAGKGTNIETAHRIGTLYAELVTEGASPLIAPYDSLLRGFSFERGSINTGTGGMFNAPKGEYLELFGALQPIIEEKVSRGGFADDSLVSVLVLEMVLLRLSQGFSRIQIDLWPRTRMQFNDFYKYLEQLKVLDVNVRTEIVCLRLIPQGDLAVLQSHVAESVLLSRGLSEQLREQMEQLWYRSSEVRCENIPLPRARYTEELQVVLQLFSQLKTTKRTEIEEILINELIVIIERVSFRFRKTLEKGEEIRPDEFPLTVLKRLRVYLGDTSVVFLEENAHLVSSYETPDRVIGPLLESLIDTLPHEDQRWEALKKVIGELALSIVNKEEPIAGDIKAAVGGILGL